MRIGVEIEAGELALALSWEQAELSEAIGWADGYIALAETPDDRLTRISLARSVSQALEPLNSLSKDVDYWLIIARFVERIAYRSDIQAKEALQLSKLLFHLAVRPDAPQYLAPFHSHWDELSLAIDGVYGDVSACLDSFISDLKQAAFLGSQVGASRCRS